MRAMVLPARRAAALEERPDPEPGRGEILVRVEACGVCRTDLHVVDGELPDPQLPIVPGHEIVGRRRSASATASTLAPRRARRRCLARPRVRPLRLLRERRARTCATRRSSPATRRDGGFATHALADAAFCLPLCRRRSTPSRRAPLLCAGLIGWRSLKPRATASGSASTASAPRRTSSRRSPLAGSRVFAFTAPATQAAQAFARSLGAEWAGGSDEPPPVPLDAAILFAPVGALVPAALRAVRKGGRVVCGGIHMSDIPSFPYRLLWEERVGRLGRQPDARRRRRVSRARADVPRARRRRRRYPLDAANDALDDLRVGRLQGAAVLVP